MTTIDPWLKTAVKTFDPVPKIIVETLDPRLETLGQKLLTKTLVETFGYIALLSWPRSRVSTRVFSLRVKGFDYHF